MVKMNKKIVLFLAGIMSVSLLTSGVLALPGWFDDFFPENFFSSSKEQFSSTSSTLMSEENIVREDRLPPDCNNDFPPPVCPDPELPKPVQPVDPIYPEECGCAKNSCPAGQICVCQDGQPYCGFNLSVGISEISVDFGEGLEDFSR